MSKNNKQENFADLPAYLGVVFFGQYGQLVGLLKEAEKSLPHGCVLVFSRYSPGQLWIKLEGEF